MEITASLVKELREKTGLGMMDCKKALEETQGDVEKAVEFLRKKGLKTAEKRGGRATSQGGIAAYIHTDGKLGALVELNCETDFASKSDDFQNLLKNLCMQVAATAPLGISPEDVPEEILTKEKEIYRDQAIQEGKPEKILDKIIEGKLKKFFEERCLLAQKYIRDDSKTIQDLLTETIATVGENMSIRRFSRFRIGE